MPATPKDLINVDEVLGSYYLTLSLMLLYLSRELLSVSGIAAQFENILQ